MSYTEKTELVFTSPDKGVEIDLDGDGIKDRVGRTYPGSQLALLWRDRNGNGKVEDGSELFGSSTLLRDGTLALNGYFALGDMDADHNGWVEPRDAGWSELLLWVDENHDSESQQREILTLDMAGIYALRV